MSDLSPSGLNPYSSPTVNPVKPLDEPTSLIHAVNQGERYYVVPFVFSILVMSFRRNVGSKIYTITDSNWPIGPLIFATIITGTLGWWGFPWGIIWSIPTLIQLWGGGKDMTRNMLEQQMSTEDAKRLLREAPQPVKSGMIWVVRLFVLAALSLPASLIFAIIRG